MGWGLHATFMCSRVVRWYTGTSAHRGGTRFRQALHCPRAESERSPSIIGLSSAYTNGFGVYWTSNERK